MGLSLGLIDEDLFRWRLCFQGPEDTPFEGGLYEATLTFPHDFPQMPPKMVFKTEMFHPNSKSVMTQFTPLAKSAFRFCTRPSKTR